MQQQHQMAIQFFLKEMNAEIKPQTDSSAGLEKRPLPSAPNQDLSEMQGAWTLGQIDSQCSIVHHVSASKGYAVWCSQTNILQHTAPAIALPSLVINP